MELLLRRLVVPHDAGSSLLPGVLKEPYQAEIQHVVPGDDQQVVIQAQRVDGELDVAHGPEPGLVRGGPVVQDGDLFRFLRFARNDRRSPVFEDRGELVVGDDHVLVDQAGAVYVVDEPVQDGLLPYFQEGFREVLGEGVEPRGVAGGEDQAFHKFNPSALSQI